MSNPGKHFFMPSPFQNKIHIRKVVPTYKQNPEERNQTWRQVRKTRRGGLKTNNTKMENQKSQKLPHIASLNCTTGKKDT